ncbi:MAG: hypothetical protein AAFX65_12300 [Cyanobacteria bacterium J06638_7]
MSLTHCPLCVAMAVLSAARGFSHALLIWRLLRRREGSAGSALGPALFNLSLPPLPSPPPALP